MQLLLPSGYGSCIRLHTPYVCVGHDLMQEFNGINGIRALDINIYYSIVLHPRSRTTSTSNQRRHMDKCLTSVMHMIVNALRLIKSHLSRLNFNI